MKKLFISLILIYSTIYGKDNDICANKHVIKMKLNSAIYLHKKAIEQNDKKKIMLTDNFITFYGLLYSYCNFEPNLKNKILDKVENDYDSWS